MSHYLPANLETKPRFQGHTIMPLTPKQERFCLEYIKDLNGTQAAIRAGYSEATAQEQSSRLLSNVMIRDHIAELQKPIAEKAIVDAEYVLRGLKKIADTMTDNMIEIAEDGSTKVIPAAAQAAAKAQELLGKHLVLFTEKVVHEHINDPLDEMAKAREFLEKHGIKPTITH